MILAPRYWSSVREGRGHVNEHPPSMRESGSLQDTGGTEILLAKQLVSMVPLTV